MSRMRSRNIAAVILAGGIGKRVGKLKQFLPINGRPLMFYSIKAFIETPFIKKVIVVVPPSRKLYAQRLVGKYIQDPRLHFVSGGRTRRWSTYEGLRIIRTEQQHHTPITHVIVHDAARPLITPRDIRRVAKDMLRFGGVVTGAPSNGIPLNVKNGFVVDVHNKKRSGLHDGTTPQCFRFAELWRAYEKTEHMKRVDDSADNLEILKAAGSRLKIKMLTTYPNLKVTYPADLRMAESILRNR